MMAGKEIDVRESLFFKDYLQSQDSQSNRVITELISTSNNSNNQSRQARSISRQGMILNDKGRPSGGGGVGVHPRSYINSQVNDSQTIKKDANTPDGQDHVNFDDIKSFSAMMSANGCAGARGSQHSIHTVQIEFND